MQRRPVRWIAVGAAVALVVCISSAVRVAAQASRREVAGPGPQAVSLTLDELIRTVLSNHPDLEAASSATTRGTDARPSRGALLAVGYSAAGAGATEAGLRELVNSVLFEAIRAYWGQVRSIEEVEIRERAVSAAEAIARGARGGANAEETELLAATAQTFLAETRISLHQAQQQAAAGEDRLKLLMNDEMLSVVTDTRLVLLTEAQEPPPMDDLDVEEGIDTAVFNGLASEEDRRDKAARRRYETLALELKTARRQSLAARTMFLLARSHQTAAQKALDAADEMRPDRQTSAAAVLLARIRAEQALCDAERQLIAACVDYHIALAAWDRATGELHETWNIRIEAARP
ncbi:MAG: hypothetical protein WBF17_17865 [Phycisphaerae bacterium]